MKSRIRSRWHRANEKPLENNSASSTIAPMGEITEPRSLTFTDDLSHYKPSDQKEISSSKKGGQYDRTRNQGTAKSHNKNRNPRSKKHHAKEEFEKNDRSGESQSYQKRKKHKPRRKSGQRDNQRSPKGDSNHSKGQNKKSYSSKKSAEHKPKASGIKGFLGKIFGS